MKRLIIVLAILVAAVSVVRWVVGVSKPEGKDDSPLTTRFTAPKFVGYHKGVRQWALEADAVEEHQTEDGEQVVHVQRVRNGLLYRDDGEVAMRFEANAGVWRPSSADLTLEGDVAFVNSDGMHFTTQQAHWNADTEQLTSPGQVHITYKEYDFVADRLFADVKGDRYEFEGNVSWKSSSGALVRARSAVYSDKKGTLEFIELDGPAQLVFGD